MTRFLTLIIIISNAVLGSAAFSSSGSGSDYLYSSRYNGGSGDVPSSKIPTEKAVNGTGVQGGDTGGAGAVANANSTVGDGNNGIGTGNIGSGNLGTGNESDTGNAGEPHTNDTDGGPTTTDGGPTTTDGGPTTTDGGPTTTDGGPTTTDGGPTTTDGGPTTTDGGPTTTDGGPTTTDGGPTTTDGGPTTTDGGANDGGTNGEPRDLDFKVNYIPLIYTDFVKTRKVINLTPATNIPSDTPSIANILKSYQEVGCEEQQEIPMNDQCTSFDFFRPIELEVDQYRNGFRVIDYYDFIIGAGEASNFSLLNGPRIGSLFNATVGLMPMGGKSLKIERFVKTQKETQRSEIELKRAKFPYKVESLFKNFKVGDSAEVTSQGGILAFASAGFAGFQLGVNYLFSGEWKTSVQLGENQMVSVKVDKIKVHTIAGSAGVGVITVAVSHFRNMDNSFSFMLDLSKKENIAIYQDLVKGHLIPAQKAAKNALSGVQIVSSYKARTLGRKKIAYIGLPIFINKTWQSGVAESSVESLEKDGRNYLIHVGSFFNNSSYRRINKTDDKIETFIGQMVEPKDKKGEKRLSAQFAWGFVTTDLWMPRMNYELNKFYKFSGLKNNFGIVIPNIKDLGNINTSVELNIPHDGVVNLLNLQKGTLTSNGTKALDAYFQKGDESKLCVAHPTSKVCRGVWRKKTVKSLRKAEKILLEMRGEKNASEFAKDFALLGKEMLDNQFSFQAILKSTCTPATFNVTVEGKRVSRVIKNTVLPNPCN